MKVKNIIELLASIICPILSIIVLQAVTMSKHLQKSGYTSTQDELLSRIPTIIAFLIVSKGVVLFIKLIKFIFGYFKQSVAK